MYNSFFILYGVYMWFRFFIEFFRMLYQDLLCLPGHRKLCLYIDYQQFQSSLCLCNLNAAAYPLLVFNFGNTQHFAGKFLVPFLVVKRLQPIKVTCFSLCLPVGLTHFLPVLSYFVF
jgi:hypothetical protein